MCWYLEHSLQTDSQSSNLWLLPFPKVYFQIRGWMTLPSFSSVWWESPWVLQSGRLKFHLLNYKKKKNKTYQLLSWYFSPQNQVMGEWIHSCWLFKRVPEIWVYVLRFDLRSSWLLSKHSYLASSLPNLFFFNIMDYLMSSLVILNVSVLKL